MSTAIKVFCIVIYILIRIFYAAAAIYSGNKFIDDPSKPEWLIATLLAFIAMAQ